MNWKILLVLAGVGVLVLASCAPGSAGSYTTKHGVFVDGSESDWLPLDSAELMEDKAIEIAAGHGIENPAQYLDGLTVHLRAAPFECIPGGELCYGSTLVNYGSHPRVDLASAGYCPEFSYYVHELLHVISIRSGNGHDSNHQAAWWSNAVDVRRELYWLHCWAAS